MLDLNKISERVAAFGDFRAGEERRKREQLSCALEVLEACSADWEELRQQVAKGSPERLVAGLREAPNRRYRCKERPTPVTVVATDGSQIYPDRHLDPPCYLLNISRIAFQYGTLEPPRMEAEPHFHFRPDDLHDHFDDELGTMTTELVSALRDEYELRALFDTAQQARVPERPLLALADGTLIRWMIRGMRNHSLEQELIGRYTRLLESFEQEGIPLASYVSMPGNREVINLLRFYRRGRPEEAEPEPELDVLLDRQLFHHLLAPGERSAVFLSGSHIQAEYGARNQICYFYVRVPAPAGEDEISRIEIPRWLADRSDLLDLVHSTVVSECRKGEGYPVILSEAHEKAVIRAPERELFYRMLERALGEKGLRLRGSRKREAKRRPTV